MADLRPENSSMDSVDESTAVVERRRAETRVVEAQEGSQRTNAAVLAFMKIVDEAREMHQKNDYARRLRPIYQGSNRA